MKRIITIIVMVAMLLALFPATAAALEIKATAAVLIDATTGRVIYEQNAKQALPPASTTKVLTALLVLEQVEDLDQTITLPDDFINVGESSINLQPGDIVSYRDLLYALMLRSANDAAQALAIGVSGSEKAFADLMNQRTKELGLKDSYWVNPHGLDHPSNMVTAYDLAMITREALHHELFNEIIVAEKHTVHIANRDDIVVTNHNQLLELYQYADGVKTGYTTVAGSCLSASATKDGLRFVGVVLGGNSVNSSEPTYYQEMLRMMEFGFKESDSIIAGHKGDVVGTVKVKGGRFRRMDVVLGETVYISIDSGLQYQPQVKYDIPDVLPAPFANGDVVGKATYTDNEGNVFVVPLLAQKGTDVLNFQVAFSEVWQRFVSVLLPVPDKR